jgi:hypothetical protein
MLYTSLMSGAPLDLDLIPCGRVTPVTRPHRAAFMQACGLVNDRGTHLLPVHRSRRDRTPRQLAPRCQRVDDDLHCRFDATQRVHVVGLA